MATYERLACMTAAENERPPPWSGRLVLTPGMVVYLGPGGDSAPHSHNAVQLFWSFDEPFRLTTGTGTVTCHSALLPPRVEHSLECASLQFVGAFFEPLGPRGSDLESIAEMRLGTNIDELLPAPASLPSNDPLEIARAALGGLLPETSEPPAMSDHVAIALAYLEQAIEGKPSLEEAALAASISPSRLTHLFTEEMGIPFRRFVLWLRLRRTVDEIAGGANLTEAAISAGFSDSSHLSRVFRESFGLSPSALLGMDVRSDWPD